MMKFESRFMNY